MENYTGQQIEYIATVTTRDLEVLRGVWHIENLKVSVGEDCLWIKGITSAQLENPKLKVLPGVTFFIHKKNRLIPIGKLLPVARFPEHLKFQNIQLACPIAIEQWNHNYFGINDTIKIRLQETAVVQKSVAILAPLNSYNNQLIVNAGNYRLERLQFTLINDSHVFIVGEPLLALQGEAFWLRNKNFYPNVFEIQFSILEQQLVQKHTYEDSSVHLLWYKDRTYDVIPDRTFNVLSRSSYRKLIEMTAP